MRIASGVSSAETAGKRIDRQEFTAGPHPVDVRVAGSRHRLAGSHAWLLGPKKVAGVVGCCVPPSLVGAASLIPRTSHPSRRLPLGFSELMIWSADGLPCAKAGRLPRINGVDDESRLYWARASPLLAVVRPSYSTDGMTKTRICAVEPRSETHPGRVESACETWSRLVQDLAQLVLAPRRPGCHLRSRTQSSFRSSRSPACSRSIT